MQRALYLRVLVGAALIAAAVLLVYSPATNGGFILDDNRLLTENELIRDSGGLYRFWCSALATDYWPATNSSLWIEWRQWGMRPAGYHITNLILHTAESLLIWVILRKLAVPGAFLAALVFAVHPVNVASVAWITQRKNTMALLFFLLLTLWYIKGMQCAASKTAPGRLESASRDTTSGVIHPSSFIPHPSSLYWFSLAAFVGAMLGKGSVAVLPVLLLVIVWWRRPLTWKDLLLIAPFFAVAALLTIVNLWFQTHGTEAVARDAGFTERLLGAGGAIWFYLYKAVLPLDLAFVYPLWHIKTGNPLWWLPLFAALIVTAALWRLRGTWSRTILFAWAWICVALAPVLGFIDVGFMRFSLVADHYQHIAIIGPVALAAAAWSAWQRHAQGRSHWAAVAIAPLAVAALMLLTWRQTDLYRHAITLYQDTLQKNPDCWMVQNNMGLALKDAGRPQLAIEYYRRALLLNPRFADAESNLGNPLFETGKIGEAIEHLERALSLNPNHAPAHNNLGVILAQTGRPQEAIQHYKQALKIKPYFPEVYNNLGNLVYGKGQMRDAIEYFQKALSLKPDFPEVQYNLGNALVQDKQPQKAIAHYRESLRLMPNQPQVLYSQGIALMQIDRPQEAAEQFRQALLFQPDYIEAYFNLALAYAKTGRPADAVLMAQKALSITRAKGKKEYVKEIEQWLDANRAGKTN